MCLSTAYAVQNGSEEKLCEYICKFTVNGDEITFIDMMGSETTVKAKLLSCDLVHTRIEIERL